MKKIFLGLAIFIVLLLAALITLPYIFKDQIIAKVKTVANENLTATLDFKDVDISIFRHFPKLSVGLEGLDVTGTGHFEGVKLIQCKRLDVAINLWSAIFGSQVSIQRLYFLEPDIKVYVLSNGAANYDITKPDPNASTTTTTSSASSPIKLEYYAIENGKILYDDRSLNMRMELAGLDHSGSGELTATVYDLVMKSHAEQLSVNYGGVQYLSNAKADWLATLGADMDKMRFEFKNNDLKVNDLQVDLNGWVEMPKEDILMDMSFSTPSNTFKSLLSIVPGAYTKEFAGVQANGNVAFSGFVKGKYNETTYPAFKLDFKVDNADFKYPSLPLGVSNINVNAAINSPSSNLNDMKVDVPKFSLKIGSNPLEGFFYLKTPESDPNVNMKLDGTLNLGELAKAFPMEGVQELTGIIKANMTLKAAMSQVESQQYDQVNMAGDFAMQNINYRATGTPAVKINNLSTHLTPKAVNIEDFDAKLGRSDLKASGNIDNILAYFSTNKTMTGNLAFSSVYFDANEWTETPPATGTTTTTTTTVVPNDVPAASEKVFDRWDFIVDGKISKLKYDVYDISGMFLKGHFKPNKMDISDFGLKLGASDLSGNGQILNVWNYLFDNQTLEGVINLNSNYFDLNPFMTTAPSTATVAAAGPPPAPAAVMPVPDHMNMTINAKFAKLNYTNVVLENLDGAVVVNNNVAKIKDCTASILGGQVALNGEYNTKDISKPSFNVDLALQKMGFRDAYKNFATVKALAPVAQLIDGVFNTTLSMSGILGKDMMPDLTTLSAAGFLETVNAVVANFKPLDEIGSKLDLPYLKKLELANTKNWFEVKDGKVTVKPFNIKMKDVAMQVGGSSGIGGDMNYQIVTKAPRKILGAAANGGLSFLSKEASKYGVNIAQGDFIKVRFDLLGSLFNPKVSMKVLGSDGQSTLQEQTGNAGQAALNQAKDTLGTMANKELDKAKEKAKQAADKAADSLRNVANRELEKAKEKAVQETKEQVGKVLGKEVGDKVGNEVGSEVGKKAGEVLGDKGTKTVEDAKKKLESWDPFKKKKN
jgi:F0F1-type ATP synthase membrane subunit b/b'